MYFGNHSRRVEIDWAEFEDPDDVDSNTDKDFDPDSGDANVDSEPEVLNLPELEVTTNGSKDEDEDIDDEDEEVGDEDDIRMDDEDCELEPQFKRKKTK